MEVLSLFKHQSENRNKITYIAINKIRPNPYQPRKHFDAMALDELAASIRQYGVLQPISVRKIGNGYELIAGERRLKASCIAGLIELPGIITEFNDNDSAIIALLENLQREDLSFFEEAQGYNSLVEEHGLTQENLALKIGKKQSTIANKIRLLKLPPRIKNIISEHNLTERHARTLLKLPTENIQMKALKDICEKSMNVQQTEEYVETMLFKYSSEPSPTQKRKTIRIFRDIRIFINTIKQAVDLMNKSGISAELKKEENDLYVDYHIRIKK